MKWISCYDQLPAHSQQVIFRTDHEGVYCGRFYFFQNPVPRHVFRALGSLPFGGPIGWNFRPERENSEVHEWMPLPE